MTISGNNIHVDTQNHKCGFVAIAGLPNAGKSTLMNRYLNEKLSIVSPKPQTTRTNVTCILSADAYQVVFIDTPGIMKPRYKMQEVMSSFISSAIDEADVILFLVDASHFKGSYPESVLTLYESIKNKHVIIALNKIDTMKKQFLLPIIEETARQFPNTEIVPISALEGEGTDELFTSILSAMPVSPKLFPDDIVSFEPERFFVAELIREAVFLSTDEEIPYSSAITIENYKEKEDLTVIYANIIVEKKSQKPIVIGNKGSKIRDIGTKARVAIEEFLGKRIYLDLHVKVVPEWRSKDSQLRETGLLRRK